MAAGASTLQLLCFITCLVLSLALFITGALGMSVLLDTQGTSYLSRSEFGRLYRRIVAFHPFLSAFIFNGGLIGTMFSIMKLAEANKLRKRSEGSSASTGSPGSSTDSKKDD